MNLPGRQLLLLAVIGLVYSSPADDSSTERKLEANGVKVKIELTGAKLTISELKSDDSSGGGSGMTTAAMEDDMTTEADSQEEMTTTAAPSGGFPGRKKRDTHDEDGMSIMVELVSLTEVDSNGMEVGANVSVEHKFDSLGTQAFVAADANDASEIPYSNATDGNGKISAESDTLQASGLGDTTTTLTMMVYIPKADGKINLDGEMMDVKAGQVKFSYKLESWTWCTEEDENCLNGDVKEVGAYLDMTIKVTSSKTASNKKDENDKPVMYDIGDMAMFMASKKVKAANVWTSMDTNYPKHEASGDKATMFTFRFPKPTVAGSIEYDPTIQIAIKGSGVTGGAGQAVASIVVLVLGMFLAML